MTNFSADDAADLVTITRRAPLQNMDEAGHVNQLLKRFVEFFEAYESGALFDDSQNGSID
jgi:hypothetical protein